MRRRSTVACGLDHQPFNGIIGLPWRDLPAAFGKWNSVFTRFSRLARAGVFERVFERLSEQARE